MSIRGFVDKRNLNSLGVKIKIKKPLSGIMEERKLRGDLAKNGTPVVVQLWLKSGHGG